MSYRCQLCKRTVREIAEEEIRERGSCDAGIEVTIKNEFAFPYYLCNECEEFLRLVILIVMGEEGLPTKNNAEIADKKQE